MIKRSYRWATGFSILLAAAVGASGASPDMHLLERTGDRVKEFADQLSSVSSIETVVQEKLNEKGKVVINARTAYDYLLSLRWDSEGLLLDESRLPIGQSLKKAPQGALLATQGFATLSLIFHPEYQPSYAFTALGEEETAGRKTVKVGFLARNGLRSPGILELKGRNFPITWEGTAWIDPELAVVTHIEAHWREPSDEIGLQELSSEVRYSPVGLHGGAQTFWLPQTARVEVKTKHQRWRNSHQFAGYKLFTVDADSKIEGGKK
jgi:hypothetical protein